VKAHYINRFLSGYKLESTYDSGQPGTFVIGQSNMVPGLTDGLLLLKNGEKATIIIPSHLGYGRYGAYYQGIPPNAVLVYEINVLEVK
jgi:FKBP-type peptidyl-prolyl cis-trans isomerase